MYCVLVWKPASYPDNRALNITNQTPGKHDCDRPEVKTIEALGPAESHMERGLTAGACITMNIH